jgi:hypothetical protein
MLPATGHTQLIDGSSIPESCCPPQETAKERGLSLEVHAHPTCAKYLDLMSEYSEKPYPIAALVW